MYQGFDVNLEARFENGAFLRGGFGATSRLLDNCNLLAAGVDAFSTGANSTNAGRGGHPMQGTEVYPDGTTACHREYRLPAGRGRHGLLHVPVATSRVTRHLSAQPRRADRRRGSRASRRTGRSRNAARQPVPRPATGRARPSKTVQLIREGLEYGEHNLHQLDLRASKRFRFEPLPLPCGLRSLQRVQQQLAVHRHLDVLDGRHRDLAAPDQRAPGPVLQDRRAVRLLVRLRAPGSRLAWTWSLGRPDRPRPVPLGLKPEAPGARSQEPEAISPWYHSRSMRSRRRQHLVIAFLLLVGPHPHSRITLHSSPSASSVDSRPRVSLSGPHAYSRVALHSSPAQHALHRIPSVPDELLNRPLSPCGRGPAAPTTPCRHIVEGRAGLLRPGAGVPAFLRLGRSGAVVQPGASGATPPWRWRTLGLSVAYTELNAPAKARAAIERAQALAKGAPAHDRAHVEARALQMAAEANAGDTTRLPRVSCGARSGRLREPEGRRAPAAEGRGRVCRTPPTAGREAPLARRRSSSARSTSSRATSRRITI